MKNKNKRIIVGGLILLVISSCMVALPFVDIWPFTLRHEEEEKITPTESVSSQNITAPVSEVTIYSNGMAFVKRTGNFDSGGEKGIFELVLSNFTQPIEDSLLIYDDKGSIKEWYIRKSKKVKEVKENFTRSFDEILNESLGKQIKVKLMNNSFTGKLVWLGQREKLGIEFDGRGILFLNLEDIKEILIYGANVSKRIKTENKTTIIPELVIKEVSLGKGIHNFLLSYLRTGANWRVNYKFYTNSEKEEGFGTLQSWAFVTNNAAENWENVLLKLVVGYPNIIRYYQPIYKPRYYEYKAKEAMDIQAIAPPTAVEEEFTPETVGEYCIYTLEEPITINLSQSKNLPIFSKDEVKFKRKYRWNANLGNDAYKIYEINNTLDVPWAEGVFSIYLKGEFEGQDKIKYTPKESLVEIKVNKAPDIVVKKEILEKTQEKGEEVISGGGWPRKYATKTYYKVRLSLENHKDTDATLVIKDEMQRGDEVNLISATIKPEVKLYSLKWDNLKLKGWGKREIEYEYEVKNWYVR
jgi:hypothetical protein